MKIIDLLKKSKWWFFSGTLISIFIISSHLLLEQYLVGNLGFNVIFITFFTICLLISFLTEILIKSKSWFSLFVGTFFIGIYIGIIYFLIYWIGYEVIIQQAWKDPMFEYNAGFAFVLPMIITMICIIPGIVLGGFIAKLIRACINRIK